MFNKENTKLPHIHPNNMLFGIREISRMTGVSTRQIRYWEQKGYIDSSTREDEHATREYNYITLMKIARIKEYLDQGMTLQVAKEHLDEISKQTYLIREFLATSFQGTEIIDGKEMINLGYFDPEQKLTLYAYLEDERPIYVVR
jgi:DNA-binding transcriptional MerR regulator